MRKIIIFWCVVLGLMVFTILSYAQEPALIYDAGGNYRGMFVVNQGTALGYDASGDYKGLVVLPLPPPQWR
jgi:hypothetical protein